MMKDLGTVREDEGQYLGTVQFLRFQFSSEGMWCGECDG